MPSRMSRVSRGGGTTGKMGDSGIWGFQGHSTVSQVGSTLCVKEVSGK